MLEALAKPGVVRAIASAMQGELSEAKAQEVLAFMKGEVPRDK
jgi:alpha-D-ribose 1-methylphosphonate 5-triphosphate synthase subunit PhnH